MDERAADLPARAGAAGAAHREHAAARRVAGQGGDHCGRSVLRFHFGLVGGGAERARCGAGFFEEDIFSFTTACNLGIGGFFVYWQRFPPRLFQWLVFMLGLLEGLFVSGLVMITDGFASIAYWVFPVLIVLNAISIPLATPQIVLNLLLGIFLFERRAVVFEGAVGGIAILRCSCVLQTNAVPSAVSNPLVSTNLADGRIFPADRHKCRRTELPAPTGLARTNLVHGYQALPTKQDEMMPRTRTCRRSFVLWLLTACCYGAQVLRRAIEESPGIRRARRPVAFRRPARRRVCAPDQKSARHHQQRRLLAATRGERRADGYFASNSKSSRRKWSARTRSSRRSWATRS